MIMIFHFIQQTHKFAKTFAFIIKHNAYLYASNVNYCLLNYEILFDTCTNNNSVTHTHTPERY